MVTQLDIARRLGISRQLVSFALAGYPHVAPASRERILAAAAEMGYQPNPHARALRDRRSGIAALWIPNQISSHFTCVTRVLTRLLKSAGLELIVSEVGSSEAGQTLSHVPVDGIFVVDAPRQALHFLEHEPVTQTPVVSMGASCCPETDAVEIDLLAGARSATRHLIETGARRIAHMTFVHEGHEEQARRRGYQETLEAAGLKPEFIYYPLSDNQRPIVRTLIQKYIGQHGQPEAIFCHSDDVAIGVYRGLRDMGLRVPGDILLLGCDGIPDTEYLDCPLSTLVQPVERMCQTAWQFLRNRQKSPDLPRQHALIPPVLEPRESTRTLTLKPSTP